MEITHYDLVNNSFTLLLNQISRFAVPLFFMVSGFALEISSSHSPIGVKKYFKKRVGRILFPYLIWSAIYYYFIYTNHSTNFFGALLTGSASYQLYFIPSLFIFYLIFPFIHKIYRIITNKWMLIILGILELYLLHQDYATHTSIFPYPITVALFNYYVFILGIIFARSRAKITQRLKQLWPIIVILAVLAGCFVFYEGRTNYLRTYNFEAFYSQWRPSILIYTILIASALYYFANKFQLKFKALSNLSFFVFFVHIIVLEFVWRFFVGNDILFFSVTAILSFLVAYIASVIPIISKSILKRINGIALGNNYS